MSNVTDLMKERLSAAVYRIEIAFFGDNFEQSESFYLAIPRIWTSDLMKERLSAAVYRIEIAFLHAGLGIHCALKLTWL